MIQISYLLYMVHCSFFSLSFFSFCISSIWCFSFFFFSCSMKISSLFKNMSQYQSNSNSWMVSNQGQCQFIGVSEGCLYSSTSTEEEWKVEDSLYHFLFPCSVQTPFLDKKFQKATIFPRWRRNTSPTPLIQKHFCGRGKYSITQMCPQCKEGRWIIDGPK